MQHKSDVGVLFYFSCNASDRLPKYVKYVTRGSKSSSSFLGSFAVMQTNILFVDCVDVTPQTRFDSWKIFSHAISLPLFSAKKQGSVVVLSGEEEDNPTMGTCWINVAGVAVSFFWPFLW